MRRLLLIFIFLFNPYLILGTPHIFEKFNGFCNYTFSNGHTLTFPRRLYSVTNQRYSIFYNLCGSEVESKCGNKSAPCLLIKKTKKIINLGQMYAPVDSDDFIVESQNGDKCTSDTSKNFRLIVNLVCTNGIKTEPRLLLSDDDCIFEINMRSPNCAPKCTALIENSYFLDFRNLPKNINIFSSNRQFNISLCGVNSNCGSSQISACEILRNDIIPLAKTDRQVINYDESKSELTIRGRYKDRDVERDINVLIRCNWEKELTRMKFIPARPQGRHYKFEISSTFGCIKLPQNCLLSDFSNSMYNLEKLYKPQFWQVSNVSSGQMFLNLCGPLKLNGRNTCTDQHSQVCLQQGNSYINLGSLFSPFSVTDGSIKLSIESGSICNKTSETLYRTEIELICSRVERGPIFRSKENCTYKIYWNTPEACPVEHYEGDNCLVTDSMGHRNIQQLYKSEDLSFTLPSKVRLIYNLCGPLHSSCRGLNNVSACLKIGNKDVILGWDTKRLLSDNGLLKLELNGDNCLNYNEKTRVIINFVCNFESPSPSPQIITIRDNCYFNITIFTKYACYSEPNFKQCTINDGQHCYDLSGLTLHQGNYVVNDGNVLYVLNVCGPIITESNALCRKDSMVCMLNQNEPTIKKRFTTLGATTSLSKQNNTLIMESIGGYCEGYGFYKTVYIFECSRIEQRPRILKKENCSFTFLWQTPHACPKNVCSASATTSIGLEQFKFKRFKLNLDSETEFTFDLNEDSYQDCEKGSCSIKQLNRNLTYKEEDLFIQLNLQDRECIKPTLFNKILIKYDENIKNGEFVKESLINCTLYITIQEVSNKTATKENSDNSNQDLKYKYELVDPEETTEQIQNLTPQMFNNHLNCTISDTKNNLKFSINEVQQNKLYFEDNSYDINFNGNIPECGGLLCKNNEIIIPFLYQCPENKFNYTSKSIKLIFSSMISCSDIGSYTIEFRLTCSENNHTNIIQDNNCKVIMENRNSQICLFFDETKTSSVGIILGSVVTLCILIVLGAIAFKIISRYRNHDYTPISFRDLFTPFYLKDASE